MKNSGNFDYLRNTNVYESHISDPIPFMVQLSGQFLNMKNFEYVKKIECFQEITEISNMMIMSYFLDFSILLYHLGDINVYNTCLDLLSSVLVQEGVYKNSNNK